MNLDPLILSVRSESTKAKNDMSAIDSVERDCVRYIRKGKNKENRSEKNFRFRVYRANRAYEQSR